MKRKRRKFTKEFKEEAVNLVLEHGYQLSEASRNLRFMQTYSGGGNVNMRMTEKVVLTMGVVSDYSSSQGKQTPENGTRNPKKGSSLLCERISMRFHFIDSVRKAYPLY